MTNYQLTDADHDIIMEMASDMVDEGEIVEPRHVAQAAANYREHIYDMATTPTTAEAFPSCAPGPWDKDGRYQVVDVNGNLLFSVSREFVPCGPQQEGWRDFILSRVNAPAPDWPEGHAGALLSSAVVRVCSLAERLGNALDKQAGKVVLEWWNTPARVNAPAPEGGTR